MAREKREKPEKHEKDFDDGSPDEFKNFDLSEFVRM